MKKKLTTFTLIVIVAAASLGGYLFGQNQGATPSTQHSALIARMMIKDTIKNAYLDSKCVDAGQKVYGKSSSIMQMNLFIDTRNYEQSTWLWQRYGDTELCMSVWGPGEDGTTMYIEFGRQSSGPFQVQINDNTVLTMYEATGNPSIGYYVLTVQIGS